MLVKFSLFVLCFCSTDLVSTEENDKANASKTSLKISFPNEGIQEKTQNIKIDEDTMAKITISAKTDDNIKNKNNNLEKNENKVEKQLKDKGIINNEITEKNQNDILSQTMTAPTIPSVQDTGQVINVTGTYEPNKTNTFTIKDGAKTITINFNPQINTSCNDTTKCSNNEMEKKTNESKNKSQTSSVKKKKVISKTMTNKHKKQNGKKFHANIKSLRKIYQSSELSCVDKECEGIVANAKEPVVSNYNNTTEHVKITNKQQPVYVINRIISVDENMELTDEAIRQIANDTGGQVAVVGNGARFSSTLKGDGSNKFKQKYDLMVADKLSYGEVAFVDDYNN